MSSISGTPKELSIAASDSASIDAFGRWRVSQPETLFDSKQLFDNQPLVWDEELESGSGISSSHSTDEAATTITSTANTAGKFTRQTFMRFNYQPGKSQLIFMTGNIRESGGGTGGECRIGYFDDDNGLFFVDDAGTMKVVLRSSVSGSAVDTEVAQSSWNMDSLDGTGKSGKTVDFTKAHIFVFDFEWLAVGRVRFGIALEGGVIYCHEVTNFNANTGAYMSSPNLPLRYQLETTSDTPATSMTAICSTVISEGGSQELGILRYKSTEGTHVDADVADTLYAVVGIRLKTTHLDSVVKLANKSMASQTNDDFEWVIMLNPTVAGTFTYNDQTNSAVQAATGATANTVTGGTAITGGFVKNDVQSSSVLANALYLGSAIDGTRDEIVLCVRPLTANADIQGSLTWRELS